MRTDSERARDAGSQPSQRRRPPLRRAAQGRMLAGVAAGLARYFGLDVTLIRIVLVALAFLGVIGSSLAIGGFPLYLAGIPLYLACWLLIPEDGAEHSIVSHLLRSTEDRRAS